MVGESRVVLRIADNLGIEADPGESPASQHNAEDPEGLLQESQLGERVTHGLA
jgi:hypothetical protein